MRQSDKVVITGRNLHVDDLVDIAEDSLGQVIYSSTAGGPAYYILHPQKGITICVFL